MPRTLDVQPLVWMEDWKSFLVAKTLNFSLLKFTDFIIFLVPCRDSTWKSTIFNTEDTQLRC